jgi:hypothetical protein
MSKLFVVTFDTTSVIERQLLPVFYLCIRRRVQGYLCDGVCRLNTSVVYAVKAVSSAAQNCGSASGQ